MSSVKEQDVSSEICKFYREKTLFITGAAGFLGVVLLETLLRCCPDIRRIYILLRAKKGVQPEDRKETIFQKEIFQKLRKNDPDVLKKVIVVSGDIAQENLGMSETDLLKICRETNIVFHCAAAISFLKPISFMMQQNLLGTYNVLEVCKKIQNFEMLVYTSTAFSNCNRKTIEEKVYEVPFSVEDALNITRHGTDDELLKLFKMCKPNFPNFYTFTKCVTESLLLKNFADVPSCIIRPSVIVCCYKGSMPGFIENGSGLVSLSVGIAKGFIRVLRVSPEIRTQMIPADIAANNHVAAAFLQVTQRYPSITVYNCTANDVCSYTWFNFINTLMKHACKYPLPKQFQKPGLTLCKSPIKYWIFSLFDHYLPAAVIDILMWITGKKLRLLKLYNFFELNMKELSHFTLNEWDIKNQNFLSISEKLNTADNELFPMVLDYELEGLAKSIVSSSPQYNTKDDKPYEERQRLSYMRYFFTSFIKWSVLGGIASVFYAVVF